MPQPMSDAEALMWSVEQHPHLTSTMGAVALLDGTPDLDVVRAAICRLLAAVPRLRQKVVPATAAMTTPEWAPDSAFDLDHHVRHVQLPAPGTMDQLRALAAQVIADPFDRSRPLWRFLVVSGLSGDRAAVVLALHHAVADGEGALQMAAHLVEFAADEAPSDSVDLDAVFAADVRENRASSLRSPLTQLRRSATVAARLINETATAMADPAAAYERQTKALERARAMAAQVPGTERHVSPLWQTRSRNRRLELLQLPLQPALDRARQLGGSLNDLFVTAVLEAAVRYHQHFDSEPPQLTASMVVSTRTEDQGEVSNSFMPLTAVLPAAREMTPSERFAAVRESLGTKKENARQSADLGSLAGLAGMLPTPLTTGVALDQVRRIDFATSNLRGFPVPVWLAGRSVNALYPVGPALGTAFNVTLMSNLDQLHLGCNIDPVAVTDPPLLARCILEGFASLGVPTTSPDGVAR